MPGVFIVLFVGVFIVIVVFSILAAEKRRKALRAWAMQNGLRFDRSKRRDLDDRFPQFQCLRRGNHRYAYNQSHGRWGEYDFHGFDYHYTTGSGKNRSTHIFSAVILTGSLDLKPLIVRPEHWGDKLGSFFGWDDIDFESAEFSRRFYVKSPDRKWAYDVLHARTIENLLVGPVYSFQFDGPSIIIWRGKRFEPHEFSEAVGYVLGVVEALPDYVLGHLQTTQGSSV